MKKFVFLMLALMVVVTFFALSHTAYADCPNGSNGVDDNIDCSGLADDTDGVITGSGNDTVTTHNVVGGNVINSGGYGVTFSGNGTLQGDGFVSGTTGVAAVGTVTYTGSGAVSGSSYGIDASGPSGSVINNGSGAVSGGIDGILAFGQVTNSSVGFVNGGNGIVSNGTVINSGTVTAISNTGIVATDVTNSSSGTITGNAFGIIANGNITNSGTVFAPVGILGTGTSQTFTLSGGTISGTVGAAVDASLGSDTIVITVGNALINGMIDGGTGNTDTLQLLADSATPAELSAANLAAAACNAIAPPDNCAGTLAFGGMTYQYQNFEQLVILLTAIANGDVPSGGGAAPSQQTGVQAICEGAIKVFRQPNGDLDVYSGFDVLPPNGFMIGRITQGELAAGVRRFQDIGTAAQLGWVVEVTLSNKMIIQVFDGQGNPIGTCTP